MVEAQGGSYPSFLALSASRGTRRTLSPGVYTPEGILRGARELEVERICGQLVLMTTSRPGYHCRDVLHVTLLA